MRARQLSFLFLVALFTVFGAGKSHFWDVVATDQAGWEYSVDLFSLKKSPPSEIRCRVRALRGEDLVVDQWTIDVGRRVLVRRSSGRSETILPGSVAERTILYFRQRGDLPNPMSPIEAEPFSGEPL